MFKIDQNGKTTESYSFSAQDLDIAKFEGTL